MRVLLRNLETGTFFKTHSHWTQTANEAYDFQDPDRAIRIGLELGLKNLEIHFTSDDGKPLFGTPLAPNP